MIDNLKITGATVVINDGKIAIESEGITITLATAREVKSIVKPAPDEGWSPTGSQIWTPRDQNWRKVDAYRVRLHTFSKATDWACTLLRWAANEPIGSPQFVAAIEILESTHKSGNYHSRISVLSHKEAEEAHRSAGRLYERSQNAHDGRLRRVATEWLVAVSGKINSGF